MSQPTPYASPAIRPVVIGNWKMNGLKSSLAEAIAIKDALAANAAGWDRADVLLCPPATLTMILAEVLKGSPVAVGGQDCHFSATGAFTGDVSAEMLKDAGATAVILGHSERRTVHGERDRDVKAKVEAAHRAGLIAIICVGETAGERAAQLTTRVVRRQMKGSLPPSAAAKNTIIAYEPVWAIGTGATPSTDDVRTVHAAIVETLGERLADGAAGFRVLYGGSVKPSNARELLHLPHVHGALVGGASLIAADFLAIVAAYGVAAA